MKKVHQCECCKNVITDPYNTNMKEFYYSQEYKYIPGTFVRRKVKRKVTLCGSCYQKISNVSVIESYPK